MQNGGEELLWEIPGGCICLSCCQLLKMTKFSANQHAQSCRAKRLKQAADKVRASALGFSVDPSGAQWRCVGCVLTIKPNIANAEQHAQSCRAKRLKQEADKVQASALGFSVDPSGELWRCVACVLTIKPNYLMISMLFRKQNL